MNLYSFKKIQISIASPQKILELSNGEVYKANTINYKTLKPKEGGLFCVKIFGTLKNLQCNCGRYTGIKYENHLCEKCGVKVTSTDIRRLQMGHITLNCPVVHIWFIKVLPSYLALILDKSLEEIEYILNSKGSDLIYAILKSFDLVTEYINLRQQLLQLKNQNERSTSFLFENADKYKRITKRFKLIESFLIYKKRPEWLMLKVLPVIPPDLRPLVKVKNNVFVSSDLNYFYKSIIKRNNRLKLLIRENVPYNLIKSEKKMLQQSVDSLLDNVRSNYQIVNKKKEPLKSLTDRLGGKEGRFRHNLLGKRVDYSGRSVIISGPKLKLSQCGLPVNMVLELFKPLIYLKIKEKEFIHSLRTESTTNYTQKQFSIIMKEIKNLIKKHPILLNRAPTLHRLNIQSFEPVLLNEKAIQLHPLVCSSFNADFDGDQMAVHLPLSLESQIETRILMFSFNNIISSANGKAIITPSQDIVFGLHYATSLSKDNNPNILNFSSYQEIQTALYSNKINIHSLVRVKIKEYLLNNNNIHKTVTTTAGRVLLYNILPKNRWSTLDLVNRQLNKKDVQTLVEFIYKTTKKFEFLEFMDKLMSFGFYYTYQAGISLTKNDLIIPLIKETNINNTIIQTNWFKFLKMNNKISSEESHKNIINIWSNCLNTVTNIMMKDIFNDNIRYKPYFYMLISSGARGSVIQMRQICNLRGLMIKPSGKVVETPITSNFKEGLTTLEYFLSTHGSRKGVIDTSIRTAAAGYLTRRLVNASQNDIIANHDCNTSKGIHLKSILSGDTKIIDLSERVYGRVLASNLINPINNKILIKKGQLITQREIKLIVQYKIEQIHIRSILTCDNKRGVCQKCYGVDLSLDKFPVIGEAVGVLAAQSIGEPGTQLTMRTFHLGGTLNTDNQTNEIRANCITKVIFLEVSYIIDKTGNSYVIGNKGKILLINENYSLIAKYVIPYGAKLLCFDGDIIGKGDIIATWDLHTKPILSINSGIAAIHSENDTLKEDLFNINKEIEILDKGHKIKRSYNGLPAKIGFNEKDSIFIQNYQKISFGDIIGQSARGFNVNQDITGDISKISQLFEASKTNTPALISPIDAYIEIYNYSNGTSKIILKSLAVKHNKNIQDIVYSINDTSIISVTNNQFISKGDLITKGNYPYEEGLKILGLYGFIEYFLTELQAIYMNQGININDKHLELVLSKMLETKKINDLYKEIDFNLNKKVTNSLIYKKNIDYLSQGKKITKANALLDGITHITLKNDSFISAGSFQNISRILTEAAMFNKVDLLIGPQENIIIGRLIPIGTGYQLPSLDNNKAG